MHETITFSIDNRVVDRAEFYKKIRRKKWFTRDTERRQRLQRWYASLICLISLIALQMEEEKALKQLRRTLVPLARHVPSFDHYHRNGRLVTQMKMKERRRQGGDGDAREAALREAMATATQGRRGWEATATAEKKPKAGEKLQKEAVIIAEGMNSIALGNLDVNLRKKKNRKLRERERDPFSARPKRYNLCLDYAFPVLIFC
ncbi:hypothetical protein ACS0TY_000207 [Phlomoides rotata]